MLVVTEAGERTMVSDRGANARLRSDDLPERLWAGAVLVSGYLLFDEGSREAAVAALERADAPAVAVDAASWPLVKELGPEAFFELTSAATILLANEDEAEALTGERGMGAADLLSGRYGIACIKQGADGAVLAAGQERHRAGAGDVIGADGADGADGPDGADGAPGTTAAIELPAVDATGAGDAFDGAFLAALARGARPEEALRRACHAGARAAATEGPWPAT
jgi:sugar/nucleoside kinase (ribokinase family)